MVQSKCCMTTTPTKDKKQFHQSRSFPHITCSQYPSAYKFDFCHHRASLVAQL